MSPVRRTEERRRAGATLELHGSLSPRRVACLLAVVVTCLTLLSIMGRLALILLPDFPLRDFTARLFDLDQEVNVPTVYSTLTLLICSALMAVIARSELMMSSRHGLPWRLLSLIFLGLALDELLSFHEELTGRVDIGTLNRFTRFSWVVVGSCLVVVLAVAFGRFFLRLPPMTRRLFLLAGMLFVGGSIGMEAIGGYYGGPGRQDSLPYVVVAHVEEVLEMAGIVVLIYALLSYLRRVTPTVVVELHIDGEGSDSQEDPASRIAMTRKRNQEVTHETHPTSPGRTAHAAPWAHEVGRDRFR